MLTAAFIDAVTWHDGILRIEGHLRPTSGTLDTRPGEDIAVAIGGRKFRATWCVRNDRAARNGPWCGFALDVPVRDWPHGSNSLAVLIGSAPPVTALKTRSLFRNDRLGRCGSFVFDVRAASNKQVIIECRAGGAAALRVLHLRSDVRAVLGRQPLWRWRLIRLLTPWYGRRGIWLLGERHDTAQDNGARLFQFIRRERRDLRAYYVVRRGSAGWTKMRPLGRVIAADSLRHKLLLIHAAYLLNAFDMDVYGIPSSWRRLDYVEFIRPRAGTRRIFLQHGVIYRDLSRIVHRLSAGYDLFLSSAERERAWIADRLDFGDSVALTGLARHDTLRPDPEPRTIVFAPTWRSDLVVPSYREGATARLLPGFEDSNYFTFMAGFLNHRRLRAALETHDYRIRILPHYELRSGFEAVVDATNRLTYLDQLTVDFQTELAKATLFVTDYSSTLFDAALLGIPAVIAHFDPVFEAAGKPQAFDLRDIGFGPVTSTVEDTVDAVIGYMERGAAREDIYDKRVLSFFAFHDHQNCARIISAIEQLE